MAYVTWDMVRETIDKHGVQGLTNRQIASLLDAPIGDVSALTRMQYEAGEIDRVPRNAHSMPVAHLYIRKPLLARRA